MTERHSSGYGLGRIDMTAQQYRQRYIHHDTFLGHISEAGFSDYADWQIAVMRCAVYHLICEALVRHGKSPAKLDMPCHELFVLEALRPVEADYTRLESDYKHGLYGYMPVTPDLARRDRAKYNAVVAALQAIA
jgi:hypothetical protein